MHGTAGIRRVGDFSGDFSGGVDVAEDHAAFGFEHVEGRIIRGVAAVAVGDRHAEQCALRGGVGEHRVGVLDAQRDGHRAELKARVAQQRAGQQAGFAGDLESVADADHGAATLRVGDDFFHDRREPRDGACAQVVTVTEAAGKDDDIRVLEVVILVPEEDGLLLEPLDDGEERVLVAVGAWERDDPYLHAAFTGCTDAIS